MPGRTVSRRFVMGLLGSGVAAAPLLARAGRLSPASCADGLVAPLAPGARLGRWVVRRIEPLSRGAVTVTLSGAAEGSPDFRVEILARDPSPLAPRPPAVTARFAVHVCNGGDGWLPTCEEQGLAAMALARVLEANEQAVDVRGFLTHAQRIDLHRVELMTEPHLSSA